MLYKWRSRNSHRMVLYCWKSMVVNLPMPSSGYLRPWMGEWTRICRICVSRPFWWFDMTAICIMNVRMGLSRISFTGIWTHPVSTKPSIVWKSKRIWTMCSTMETCQLVRTDRQFRFLVNHWSACQILSIFDLVCSFHPICSRCKCKFDWQPSFAGIGCSPNAANGHRIANTCPYNYLAAVQRQSLFQNKHFENESNHSLVPHEMHLGVRHLPGLHDDKLQTACDPTSTTHPESSSCDGSPSPPVFALITQFDL